MSVPVPEHLAEADSILESFWDGLMARHACREDAATAAFTLWVQLIKDMPVEQRDYELSTAEAVARMTIADEAEREKQARRSHLRLVHSDSQTQRDAGSASNAPAERD